MSHFEFGVSELNNVLNFTKFLARTAGKLILEGSTAILSTTPDVGEKKNSVDLVTEYDVRVEELVKSEVAKAYPEFGFIGEESYSAGTRPPLTDAPTFCVDPIDGTTNFVHGFPFVCISLGLIYKKCPVLGVIYNPFLDHMYYGVTGNGSYLIRGSAEPVKLPISTPKPLPSLSQALLAIEWGSDRALDTISGKATSFLRLAGNPEQGVEKGRMAHSLRSVGSAALNFALVAQGALDMYWEIGCWPWDVCAGIVIAQEAGGIVTGSAEAFANCNGSFDVTEEILTGRKYLVIRGIANTEAEKGVDAQARLFKEFYDTVEDVEAH